MRTLRIAVYENTVTVLLLHAGNKLACLVTMKIKIKNPNNKIIIQ